MVNRKPRPAVKVVWQPVVWQPLKAMDPLPVEVDLITALQRINEAVCATTDIDTLLQGVCDEMGRILKADRVHLALKSTDTTIFGKVDHEYRRSDEIVPTLGGELPSEQTDEVVMDIVAMPPPLAVLDPLSNPKLKEGPRKVYEYMQVMSAMAGRLMYQGKILGMICVHQCDHVRQWTSQEATFLSVVLSQLSVAIANARMLKSMQAQHEELVSLHFRLEESHSALERVVEQRTAQLRQANAELVTMVEELQQLDNLKASFLDTISHELRTPINFITGFGSLLGDGAYGDLSPAAQDAVDKILEGAERLIHLVDDLLDQSKMERGHLRIQPERFDYRSLVAQIAMEFDPIMQEKGLCFVLDVPAELPRPFADPDRVHQVLRNLLSNAQKFTPTKGSVHLAVRVEGRRLVTEVQDTGIGIPTAAQQRIFERFYQVDGTRTRNYGGTGLGLAIVKGLVEAMGGQIEVASKPGQGATFRFSMPLAEGRSRQEAPQHGKDPAHRAR
ncbi:MAG: multi-sensor signal transduction histidine kinase [Cyanobacteria bacterium RYN_339]|nr:multi-sensor signal transduction histidine kinase [Cyanobacteria bacterium RYN_339]